MNAFKVVCIAEPSCQLGQNYRHTNTCNNDVVDDLCFNSELTWWCEDIFVVFSPFSSCGKTTIIYQGPLEGH